MNNNEILQEVERLSPWIVRIHLKDGIYTTDKIISTKKLFWYIHSVESVLQTFSGKRILDIGSNTGYIALEVALRGAEVVSVEPHPLNYDRCKLVYSSRGLLNNGITLIKEDMETIDMNSLGRFDAIFFCGTVYHCTYPWEVLKRYAEMTNLILVESKASLPSEVNDTSNGYEFKKFFEDFGNPLHRVFPGDVRVPTRFTLYKMIYDAGFNWVQQLMPIQGLTDQYHRERAVAFIANKIVNTDVLLDK